MKTFAVLAVLAVLMSCSGKKDPKETADPAPAVKTQTVKLVALEDRIEISGLLSSEKEARLSFKTGGILQKMEVREGDRVKEGQLLASLNLTEIRAQADQAKENLAKADRDFQRVTELYQNAVATREQRDNAASALAVAKNSWEIARYNLSFSEIRAPRDGVIVRRLVSEGEMVAGGAPVFFFAGSGKTDWTLRCGISDRNWVRLHKGDKAELVFDAFPGQVFSGQVLRLSQGADPTTGLYQADIQVEPGSMPFATGLFAQGRILLPSGRMGLRVPTEALVDGQGQKAQVFLEENGRAKAREVTVLRLDTDHALVTGDLTDGSHLIVDGAAWVASGKAVRTVQ